MESRAKLFGHPIYQMLVAFPVGLLGTAVVFDLLALQTNRQAFWVAAYYLQAAGLVGAVAAAAFGIVDYVAIRERTRAARLGWLHGVGNMTVMSLFGGSWMLRDASAQTAPGSMALLLSFAGGLLLLATAWLGGELVTRLGIGVSRGAGPNASSSLDARDAPDASVHLRKPRL